MSLTTCRAWSRPSQRRDRDGSADATAPLNSADTRAQLAKLSNDVYRQALGLQRERASAQADLRRDIHVLRRDLDRYGFRLDGVRFDTISLSDLGHMKAYMDDLKRADPRREDGECDFDEDEDEVPPPWERRPATYDEALVKDVEGAVLNNITSTLGLLGDAYQGVEALATSLIAGLADVAGSIISSVFSLTDQDLQTFARRVAERLVDEEEEESDDESVIRSEWNRVVPPRLAAAAALPRRSIRIQAQAGRNDDIDEDSGAEDEAAQRPPRIEDGVLGRLFPSSQPVRYSDFTLARRRPQRPNDDNILRLEPFPRFV